jgi:hypothetical protein
LRNLQISAELGRGKDALPYRNDLLHRQDRLRRKLGRG